MGASAGVEYLDNTFLTGQNDRDDWAFVLGPNLRLLDEPSGQLDWNLGYRMRWREPLRFKERGGLNHSLNLSGNYSLGPRTTISVSDRFSVNTSETRRGVTTQEDLGDETTIQRSTRRTIENRANLDFGHLFTPRLSTNINLAYTLRRFTQENLADIDVYSTSASLNYALTSRANVGLGGTYTHTAFSDRNSLDAAINAQRTNTTQGFLSVNYRLSPTLQLSASGGPAYISQKPPRSVLRVYPGPAGSATADQPLFQNLDSCQEIDSARRLFSTPCTVSAAGTEALTVDTFPPDDIPPGLGLPDDDSLAAVVVEPPSAQAVDLTNVTFFGQFALAKQWRAWTGSLSYRRTEAPNSGLSANTTVDSITGRASWVPERNWRLNMRVGWNRRASEGETITSRRFIYRDSGVLGTSLAGIAGQSVAELVEEQFETSKSAADITQVFLDAALSRRVARHWEVTLAFRSLIQRTGNEVARSTGREFNDYRVRLSFEYKFDAFRF